ncbi:MAG: lysylphosphatidylglycerol synthase domain-containing protein, partial [Candidatus Hydrogenedentes bacterium]|nr:lysylphosphatidylglycerol synthase domain-containing protein [Candidatus Hydrogenedentota bacterium]
MNAIENFFKDPKKVIALLIKLVFIGGIFGFMFYPDVFMEFFSRILPFEVSLKKFKGISMGELWQSIRGLDLAIAAKWLTFAAIVKIAGIFCGITRWHILLKGQGISLPFWYLTKCWFMGRAIGLFLPGTVGLDGYRLVESAAYTGEVIKCTTVVAVEKLIGFVALSVLVFLTLPLGARLFDFNMVVLAVVLAILFCFIATAFLLLLNPRIVQVLAAALPVPKAIRRQVNTLGAAVTAYSGRRGMLMVAFLLGLGIHLGIMLMYFGSAMAMSGGTSEIADILFASPLIIVASIIAPTVSGVGVREGVMTALLGGKYGEAESFLFGHIGLWIGEAVPFLLSVPLLIFAGRPNRSKFLADLEAVRAETATQEEDVHLAPEVVTDYRNKLIDSFGSGLLGGLIGGALFGLAEGIYHMSTLANYTDSAAYWWAPLVYGVTFSPIGFGVGAVLVFFYLLFNRFLRGSTTFALSLGGTVGFLGLVIGVFRYRRDVLAEAAMAGGDYAKVLIGAAVAALVCVVAGRVAARLIKGGRIKTTGVAIGSFVLIVVAGFLISIVQRPSTEATAFEPETRAAGPNIILIAVDTLRADFVKAYNVDALPETPKISALAEDSVLFQNAFAQSSWTKASFGTIFSGMYPEAHTATGKASALPRDVTTIAEVLEAGGYYTRGYSNNPNITSTFNYDQGFVDYIDLKPDLYFGAQPSCEKLVLYDILRKVVQQVNKRILGGRIIITDFYQPGESITDIGLEWLDSDARPADTPFFLFLHYMDPHDPFRDPDRPG